MAEDVPTSGGIQTIGMPSKNISVNGVYFTRNQAVPSDKESENGIVKHLCCGASSDGGSDSDSNDNIIGQVAASSTNPELDFERMRQSMCKMVVSSGISLRTSEKEGFKGFVASMCPQFDLPSPIDLIRKSLECYKEERKVVENEIQRAPGRICLTVDNMTDDIIKENCMCLVAHWIDSDWNLQRRMIGFETLIPPFDGDSVGNLIKLCLDKWKISNKVFSFTIDDPSYGDSMMSSLKAHFQEKNSSVFGGQFFEVNCAHEIITLVVKASLNIIDGVLDRIRTIVQHIRTFTSKKQKFYELANSSFGLNTSRRLIGDTDARWNATLLMLERFLYYRDVIESFTATDRDIEEFALTQEEWARVTELYNFLKVFYDLIHTYLSPPSTPTPNIYFHVIWTIFRKLSDISKGPPNFLSEMAKDLTGKFDKYWSDNCCILSCAAVLDPRYKLDRVEFCYEKLFGEAYAKEMIGKVKKTLIDLFDEYKKLVGKPKIVAEGDWELDGYEDYAAYLSKRDKLEAKSELEKYLEGWNADINKDTDVLGYWKNNSKRFPYLSCLARDILAIPISTVALKSAFSTRKNFRCVWRESIPLKSSIIMEALVCYQNWLQARSQTKDSPFYGYDDDDIEEGSEYEYKSEDGDEDEDMFEDSDDEEDDDDEVDRRRRRRI